MGVCMWYVSVCVSWKFNAPDHYKKTQHLCNTFLLPKQGVITYNDVTMCHKRTYSHISIIVEE